MSDLTRRASLAALFASAGSLLAFDGWARGPKRVPPQWRHPPYEKPPEVPWQNQLAVGLRDPTAHWMTSVMHRIYGRYVVLGKFGARYTVGLDNPFDRRIEVVVTVDGLDVRTGRRPRKGHRGYVVRSYDVLRVTRFSGDEAKRFRFAEQSGTAKQLLATVLIEIYEEESRPPDTPVPPPEKFRRARSSPIRVVSIRALSQIDRDDLGL